MSTITAIGKYSMRTNSGYVVPTSLVRSRMPEILAAFDDASLEEGQAYKQTPLPGIRGFGVGVIHYADNTRSSTLSVGCHSFTEEEVRRVAAALEALQEQADSDPDSLEGCGMNLEVLSRLPVYRGRMTPDPNPIYSDGQYPPNHPALRTHDLVGQSRRRPNWNQPQAVIVVNDNPYIVAPDGSARHDGRMERTLQDLFLPLPESDLEVEAWIRARYRWHRNTYVVPQPPDKNKRHETVTFPLADWEYRGVHGPFWDFKLQGVPKTPEVGAAIRAVEETIRDAVAHERAKIAADPANHCAVIEVRKFYPEHKPRYDLIVEFRKPEYEQKNARDPRFNPENRLPHEEGYPSASPATAMAA